MTDRRTDWLINRETDTMDGRTGGRTERLKVYIYINNRSTDRQNDSSLIDLEEN